MVYTLPERLQRDVRCFLVLHLYLLAAIREEREQAVISYVRGVQEGIFHISVLACSGKFSA